VIGTACLESPKQAWQLFNMLCQALTVAGGSAVVSEQVAGLLCAVGSTLVAADPKLAQSLMQDFGLPRLLPMLQAQSPRQKELLRVLYAFSAETPEAHIDTIRWLQEALEKDQKAFLGTLTVLITLEPSFSDELLDLYAYYCVIALSMPDPRLRSSALSMLPIIAMQNCQLVLNMLSRLTMLVEEPWWEVTAGLGKICAILLSLPPAAASEDAPALLEILLKVLGSRNPMVLRVVLPEVAPLVGAIGAVGAAFSAALVEMAPKEREALLAQSAAGMPALPVAQAMLALAKEQSPDHLVAAHAEVLLAVLGGPLAIEERDAWQGWLKANKDYLYVGLCDEELCKPIAEALLRLFGLLQELALPTFSTLFSSLRLLCDGGVPACQATADALLASLYQMGEPFADAISQLVSEFEPPMTAVMTRTVGLVGA